MREKLYKALNDLLENQFKDFKWRLKNIDHNGEPNIPTASLEKANQQEVVDLLIQYYGEDAPEVCIRVLRKSNINDVARKLEETLQIVADIDAHQHTDLSEYRNYIKKKFQIMKDPNAVPGEYVVLNKRYSELIILDYHPSKEEREHEIMATGKKHIEIINMRAKSSSSIEKLFNPDTHGLIPQVVVLQGAAGIGKTMTAKKIMFDWASKLLYQDNFNYVFYISCREMNLHAETLKTSIEEIISKQWPKCHAVRNVILKNEEKILFIIDGFDELRYSFDEPESYFCTETWKKEPVRIILSSLFQKKLLPESYLIITTRPTALEKLHRCLVLSRYFVILGFSTKERKEYFDKFFENKDQAMQAFKYVKQNDMLFTMCVIPLVSWIICTVMKQEMERGKDLQKTPCSLTAIYMLYLSSLLKFHHKESKQVVQSNVKGLCCLAAEGVWKKQILFMEEEVKKHRLDQGNSLPLFLNQSIFKKDIDCIQTYSFIHLSFQEFFAALFYVLEEGEEQQSENLNKNLQALLERQKSFRPDFDIGFRFLFGFLNEENRMRELKKEFGWEISPNIKKFFLDYVKNNFKKSSNNFRLQQEMFSYLYETQDDNFIKNAICGITEIDYRCNSDIELMILGYCIQHCQNLRCLFVKGYEFLHHAETKLFLPEKGIKRKAGHDGESYNLCRFFKRNREEYHTQWSPRRLEKPRSAGFKTVLEWSLDERYLEDFFNALTKLRNLTKLCIDGLILNEPCSRHLADILRKNQNLRVLELYLNNPDDETMELLCEGLTDRECAIETLKIIGDILSTVCSRHLAGVLRKNQKLRVLKLLFRCTDSTTVELLCRGLKDPKCKLDMLGIDGLILSEFCSRCLADLLKKNQTLKVLKLSIDHKDDKTMELLCEGLTNPECAIEKLEIIGDILSEACSRHLADVLRKNQKLRVLKLLFSRTESRTMELLCEGLKDPECKTDMLELNGEKILR